MSSPVKRLTSVLLALFALACAEDDYTRQYADKPIADSYDELDVRALEHLGATRVDRGVNFGVYSEAAERVHLYLFDDPEAELPTRDIEMTRFGDVWNVYVEGVGLGQHYGFVAWGPNWRYDPQWKPGTIHGFVADVDAEGNRFNPNKLLLDPYARAFHRDHDWSKGSTASGPARAESTIAAASKAIVVESDYVWSEAAAEFVAKRKAGAFARHGWNDLVIYEVHAKGFTASAASGVEFPGSYRGFAEKASYLAELGINAVELMPVHEKPLDGGYWGYQTLNFFMPEYSYAFPFDASPQQMRELVRQDPARVIDEFKAMVDELHQRGIEVIIDVVYNHTGEGGFWREKLEQDDHVLDADLDLTNFDPKEVAGLYSFRGLDNAAYYALDADNQTYWNNTGVGNQTRTNHLPFKKLIIDSLRWWVTELQVDGFRFDLAPVLAAKDLDYNTREQLAKTVLQEIIDDPILRAANVRIIAEPWAVGPGDWAFMLGQFPKAADGSGVAWYEWNGQFRDWWRDFVNGDVPLNHGVGPIDGGGTLTGSAALFEDDGRAPYHTVNFVTVHDGFTMYDLFSYAEKRNKCGPLNPVCCSDPFSPFCDRDSGESNNRSRDWGDEGLKRQQMRNMFTAMLVSHGTPMLYGGDEWMRTQLGNNNAYSSGADNAFNWFDWGAWGASDERNRMFDFVKKLVQFRHEHAYAFAPSAYGQSAPFAWKNAANADMTASDWGERHVAMHYYDASKGPELLLLINMESAWVPFTLPGGRTWRRVVDTQGYFDSDAYMTSEGAAPRVSHNIDPMRLVEVPTATYDVPAYSIVILEAE
jgi:isoamylase